MKRVAEFYKKFKAGWKAATTPPPAPTVLYMKNVLRSEFFLAGKDHLVLWRSNGRHGDGSPLMEQWMRNPFTKKMQWSRSYLDEWADDKAQGEPKKITPIVAEEKFPGSIRSLMVRSLMRGK